MTKPMMDLRALVEKSGDADLLRGWCQWNCLAGGNTSPLPSPA